MIAGLIFATFNMISQPMKYITLLLVLCMPVICRAQDNITEHQRDSAFYNATGKWFGAWKLVSSGVYKIKSVKPVDFVFFDDKYVYSTSGVSIANGEAVKGRNFMNLVLNWKKAPHHDSITLPDHSVVPVGLMSFAGETGGVKSKAFFVMPLPSFWQTAGVTSTELGLDNLVTGVFVHEFSHSQQMQNFGKRMTAFEQHTNFGVEFSDDIIQHLFEKDSAYTAMYQQEAKQFYTAVKSSKLDTAVLRQALNLMQTRQQTYFTGRYDSLQKIDDFFLTMEGLGQYSMYLWLVHPKGANIAPVLAIEGVRRKRKWWSQDEGLVLFLILEKIAKNRDWAKEMFGTKTTTVTSLIRQHIKHH